MSDELPRPVVFDSTVLSNFALTNSIDWLIGIVPVPITVHAIKRELEAGIEDGYDHLSTAIEALELVDSLSEANPNAISVVPPGEFARNDAPEAIERLDRGEAYALYCAWADGTLATDDLDARRIAKNYGISTTGSIGLLASGVLDGEISIETADLWLETWTEFGYYSPVDSVAELIEDVE